MRSIVHSIAQQAIFASKPVQLVEADVISAPPDLRIKVAGNDKLIIPKELIIVSEHLCKHERAADIKAGSITDLYPESPPQSSHNFVKFELNSSSVSFTDELKVGDKVMCAVMQGGQLFYVFDRIKTYE